MNREAERRLRRLVPYLNRAVQKVYAESAGSLAQEAAAFALVGVAEIVERTLRETVGTIAQDDETEQTKGEAT